MSASMSASPTRTARPAAIASILEDARHVGDPEADAIVARLGRDAWAINVLLAEVARDDDALPPSISPDLARLVVPPLPAWADLHRIRRAQAFAKVNLLPITVGLFCASLPAGYCAVEGAKVLRMAGRMTTDLDRRVNETARFVLDVLRPGSLDPGGRGRVTLGKVRLIHAAVRAALRARGYDAIPINQEDQLGTLGLFSTVVLKSLVRLGVRVDARDREDFMHLWRVAGAMLGLREHLLPSSYDEGTATLLAIAKRQYGTSEDGRALMKSLLEGMERHMMVPALRPLPAALVRYLLGIEMATCLGLVPEGQPPPRGWDATAQKTFQHLVPRVGQRLLDTITVVKLRGERVTFAMPTK
jgi:hypothetical protein